LTPALLSLADGQGTNEPHLAAIFQAHQINQVLGGAVVGPWDLDGLPDEWLDVFRALTVDLPGMRAGREKVNARLEAWRAGTRRQ